MTHKDKTSIILCVFPNKPKWTLKILKQQKYTL